MDSAPFRPSTFRQFTLRDAIVLNLATAAGVGVNWLIFFTLFYRWDSATASYPRTYAWPEQLAGWVEATMWLTMPVLAAWTVALVPLGLVPPRPRLRRLGCQPGWVAACVFSAALVFDSALIAARIWVDGIGFLAMVPLLPALNAPAIVAAWLSLILRRRWCPEPSWLDRTGRVLAILWLILAIVGPVVSYILLSTRVMITF